MEYRAIWPGRMRYGHHGGVIETLGALEMFGVEDRVGDYPGIVKMFLVILD